MVRIARSLAPCLVFLLWLYAVAHAASPRTLVAQVERVSDGDSVTATTSEGTKLRIRLLGIDAPEIAHGKMPGQPYGEEALDYLDHLIGGKTVHVDAFGRDQFKRILAVLWDDQINVNLLMVAMGYAEVYRGAACQIYCRELEQAETKARQDHVGMWAQGNKYESPHAFRQRLRLTGE